MTRRLFIFDDPDRFLAGTLGEPGDRAFFLQARKGGALISVGLEKVQVAALAHRLDDLLDAVEAPEEADAVDELPLEEPVVELFRVGAMALAWDATAEAVMIEAQTPTEDGDYVELPDDAEQGPDLLRIRINAPEARAFVRRAQALVIGPTCLPVLRTAVGSAGPLLPTRQRPAQLGARAAGGCASSGRLDSG